MTIVWREGSRDDVAAVVAMLADDMLGQGREGDDLEPYLTAFDLMKREGGNLLVVAEIDGTVVATYQLIFISGLSLKATRRAQIESVRVSSDHRGRGLGAALMADAEERARAAGCGLIQLTSNRERHRAHAFYDRLGYVASHIGYKRSLD